MTTCFCQTLPRPAEEAVDVGVCGRGRRHSLRQRGPAEGGAVGRTGGGTEAQHDQPGRHQGLHCKHR